MESICIINFVVKFFFLHSMISRSRACADMRRTITRSCRSKAIFPQMKRSVNSESRIVTSPLLSWSSLPLGSRRKKNNDNKMFISRCFLGYLDFPWNFHLNLPENQYTNLYSRYCGRKFFKKNYCLFFHMTACDFFPCRFLLLVDHHRIGNGCISSVCILFIAEIIFKIARTCYSLNKQVENIAFVLTPAIELFKIAFF